MTIFSLEPFLCWQAYSTLSNPVSRLRYNALLEQALQDHEDDYSGQLRILVKM